MVTRVLVVEPVCLTGYPFPSARQPIKYQSELVDIFSAFCSTGGTVPAKLDKKPQNTLQNPRTKRNSVMFVGAFNPLIASIAGVAVASRRVCIT